MQKTGARTGLSITLPFEPTQSTVNVVAGALIRTKSSWSWFVRAQHLDRVNNTRLGTLSYIPRELRDIIHDYILGIYSLECESKAIPRWRQGFVTAGRRSDRIWRRKFDYMWGFWPDYGQTRFRVWPSAFHAQSYLNLRPWEFGEEGPPAKPLGLRDASPTLRNESDEMFLSRSIFGFSYPEKLALFLRQMTPMQRSWLQRISLEMSIAGGTETHDDQAWKKWVGRMASRHLLLERLRLLETDVYCYA